jgi:hypothetical protein
MAFISIVQPALTLTLWSTKWFGAHLAIKRSWMMFSNTKITVKLRILVCALLVD